MNLIKTSILLVIFLSVTSPALAEIYKCPSKNGGVTFSQTRCPNGFKKENGQWSSLEEERKIKREKEITEKKRIKKELAILAAEERKEEERAKKREQIKKRNLEYAQKEADKLQKKNDALLKENPAIVRAISGSDDYFIYKYKFFRASKYLLDNKICTLEELKYMGGWVKSVNYRTTPNYFTYCGDGKKSASHPRNKFYLNAVIKSMEMQ